MIDRIAQALHLEPEEARRGLSCGAILFALTGSYTLAKTARDALYLAQLPAATLPYAYLAVGAITTAVAIAFTRLTRNAPVWRSLEIACWISAFSLAIFAYLFRIESERIAIAFYLWANVYGLILVSQFWVFANASSHPREAKRTFGIIGVGGILGGLFGGLAASPLASTLGLPALLVLAASLAAVAAHSVRYQAGPEAHRAPLAPPSRETHPARHPYLRWLALASLCSVLVATLIDFQFKVELQRRYPDSAALASFLGLFYTVTNLAALTLQLFAARWSLHTLGAGWTAAVLPAGLGIGAAFTVAIPGFAAVMTTRLWDQVMRLLINRTANELFYFPIEPALRRRAKALIDAGLERIGDALAGLLILAVGLAMVASTQLLAIIVAGLVGVWVIAWLAVRRGYVTELGTNLRRMNLAPEASMVSLREASLLQEMDRLIDSRFERVVLHGVEMLEQNAPERLLERLPRLLEHPSTAVRARAVAIAAANPSAETAALLEAMMRDGQPEVRVAALHAYCALGGESRLERMQEFLEAGDPLLRQAALECMAEYALPHEEARVRIALERTLAEGGPVERAAVARGLGRRAGPSALHDLVGPLLRDRDLPVRRAALEAAGRAGLRLHVPKLIDALGVRETREAALAGLRAFGDRVVGTLADYLTDATVPIEIRREVPRALAGIGSAESAEALMRSHERDDVRLAYRVLKAANQIHARNEAVRFPRSRVTEELDFDIRSFLFAFVHYRTSPIGGTRTAERILCLALNERMDQALNRIFRRLALLYPPRELLAAYRGVISVDPKMRGNAVEYLENALAPDHRAMVLPLVDGSGDAARLRIAETRYGIRLIDQDQSLAELLRGRDSWLRTCALYVVGARRAESFAALVDENLGATTPHVRETAAWARLALTGG